MRSAECRKYWTDMVDLAEGKNVPGAAAHAQTCPGCQARLTELKHMMSLAAKGSWDAPISSIEAARQIFAPRKPVSIATLRTVGAAARSVNAESTQLRRASDLVSVRLMIRKDAGRWHVMGMIEGPDLPLLVTCGEQTLDLVGSSVEFRVDSLDEDLWLEFADRAVRVPLRSEE